mgnify:CR=1 FL=1
MSVDWKLSPKELNRHLARLGGVRGAVRAETETQAAEKRARLAPHTANNTAERARKGESATSIKTEFGSTDGYVMLDDPDGKALIIEGKLSILRG